MRSPINGLCQRYTEIWFWVLICTLIIILFVVNRTFYGGDLPLKFYFISVVSNFIHTHTHTHPHTHTSLTAPFPGIPRWARTRKEIPIWILLEQETVSGSGISWAVCKSAPCSKQITTQAPHRSVFYRPDALPAAQPTASKHWRHQVKMVPQFFYYIKLEGAF